jgi:hypothetical protein
MDLTSTDVDQYLDFCTRALLGHNTQCKWLLKTLKHFLNVLSTRHITGEDFSNLYNPCYSANFLTLATFIH